VSLVMVNGDASLAIMRFVLLPCGTIFIPYQFTRKFVTDSLSRAYISLITGSAVSTSKPWREALWPATYARSCRIVSSVSRGPLVADLLLEEGVSPDFGIS